MTTATYRPLYDNATDCGDGEAALAHAALILDAPRIRQLVGAESRGERLRLRTGEREALGRVAWSLPNHGVRVGTALLALAYWLDL